MPPRSKDPTAHQLSSRLQYSQGVPSFLRQLQAQPRRTGMCIIRIGTRQIRWMGGLERGEPSYTV
ncbi:hypothetical protein RSAG8_04914, partial [Rhizoctonia solani AG-8 WAC10335]